MRLNEWAKSQTVEALKKISLAALLILLPIFLIALYWSQQSHIQSLYNSNSKLLLNAIQTGDLIALQKGLSGYQSDDSVRGYELLDKDDILLGSYRFKSQPILEFSKKIPILSSTGVIWGTVNIFWTLQWSVVGYFFLAFFSLVLVVGLVVFQIWNTFSGQLVGAFEELAGSLENKEIPAFINKIDDLKIFIEKIKLLQLSEIESHKLKAQFEKEREIVEISQKVAHDLRSPMSVISLVFDTIKVDEERSTLISSAICRMNEICDELLAERKKHISSQIMLISAVNEIANESKIRFKDRDLRLSFISNAESVVIPHLEFKSVLSNLLNNALEAVPSESGIVQLQSEILDDILKITISDNGCGIPSEIIEKLGNGPLTYGKGDSGNGLGFYNAQKWVKGLGGKLSIASVCKVGTQVTIEIPV